MPDCLETGTAPVSSLSGAAAAAADKRHLCSSPFASVHGWRRPITTLPGFPYGAFDMKKVHLATS